MSASRWSLLCILAVLALTPCASVGAQAIKTYAPLRIHGDLKLSGSGITFPDGSTQTSAGIAYARTVVVSPAGAPAASGDALRAALAAITDAGIDTPALLKIEPGVYDIGTLPLQMKPWVDVEGSGQAVTLVKGSVDGLESGVIVGVSNAELRFLGVENTGPGTYCAAIFSKGCSPRIFNVTARASGGDYNAGISSTANAQPEIRSVKAEASGPAIHNYGIYNVLSQPTLFDVTASATGGDTNTGIHNFGAMAAIHLASVHASGGEAAYGIYCASLVAITPPAMTALDVSASGAANQNYGIYLNSVSPPIRDARIQVRSGPANYGIYLSSCSSELLRLLAEVTGSGENYGIYIAAGSAPALHQVQVEVSEGTANHALYSTTASTSLNSVVAVATGADSHAVSMTSGGGSLKAVNSFFWGDALAVANAPAATVQLGSCRLDGGVSGPAACVGCYDGGMHPLDGDCR